MDKKYKVLVNTPWCKACGICIALCPKGILKADRKGKVIVESDENCIGCESCVIHCPDFAIEVKEA